MALYIADEEIRRLIKIDDAVAAVEEAMRDLALGMADNRPRQRPRTSSTLLHVMCAASERIGALGLKAYTTRRDGNRFLFLLFSNQTGECEAVMEADWLGRFRTGAASGVATKYLARQDAATVGVIGTGRHALTQLLSICAVRAIRTAYVWSPTAEHRSDFARQWAGYLPVPLKISNSAENLVRQSDILCTVTKARNPVLKGEWLNPGTHINAVGSNALSRQEIGEDTVSRADLIVVDSKDQAQLEAGDLVPAIAAGELSWDEVLELAEVVSADRPTRTADDQITLFESHGLGLWDLAVGKFILERAREAGAGIQLPF